MLLDCQLMLEINKNQPCIFDILVAISRNAENWLKIMQVKRIKTKVGKLAAVFIKRIAIQKSEVEKQKIRE